MGYYRYGSCMVRGCSYCTCFRGIIVIKYLLGLSLALSLSSAAFADNLVSFHQSDSLAYVLYTQEEADKLGMGANVKIKTDQGIVLKGKLLHKGKWFHKVMAKVRVTKIEKL